MKTLALIAASVALVGSMAFGQVSNQVLSRNAVGYVRLDIVSNTYNQIAVNWIKVGGGEIGIQDVLDTASMQKGTDVGASDNLVIWDLSMSGGSGGYRTYFLYNSATDPVWDGKWVDPVGPSIATNTFQAGDAFWVRRRGSTSVVSYIMGEVPAVNSNVQYFAPGYNMFGSSFSADIPVNSLSWVGGMKGTDVGASDNLSFWDPRQSGSGRYKTLFLYNSATDPIWDGKWVDPAGPTISTASLRVGQGVWYRRRAGTTFTWTEQRPYTWPNQ